MNLITLVLTALRAIRKHKGRSLLTITSIIVGISALISTLAIGYGAEEKIRRKISAMGNNYIFIHSGNWRVQGKTTASKRKKTKSITIKDVEFIKMHHPEAMLLSPHMSRKVQIKHQANSILSNILGETENILKITDRSIARGMFFAKSHVDKASRVAVLSSKAATELFGKRNPVDKTIYIEKTPFRVLGVLNEIKVYMSYQDPNYGVYIPITTFKRVIDKNRYTYIHGISIRARSRDEMGHLVRGIRRSMRARHKLESGEPDDFTIYDQKSMTDAAKQSSNVLMLFLLIVASISLLVGGIGVMNIMLVSVTERTKEIGIRMALGANSSSIRRQFILESITLCLIGGLLGTILGIIIPYVASYFTGWIVIHKVHVIAIAVFLTTLIGVFFGFYPAYKASNLKPVEALTDR